jgi:hypothetical protein
VETEPPFPLDVKVGPGFDDALRGMVDRTMLQSQKWQEQQWRAVRLGMHPDLLEFEKLLIRRMAALGVPMFAHSGIRSAAEQEALFADGVTKAKGGESPHNYGMAVDVVHSVLAWNLTRRQWDLVGHVGKEVAAARGLKLEWGGDWRFYDPAHWQLAGWRLLAGKYPFPPPPRG